MAQLKERVSRKVLQFTYTVIFERTEDGGYSVYIPALNGAATWGNDLEDARKWAKDMILSIIEASIEIGRPIPREEDEIKGEKMTVQFAVL